jgi:hypothetical protein
LAFSVITPGAIRDAGMFAESGAAPPPGIGTGTPQAPLRQRVLARFAMLAPEIAGRLGGLGRYQGG